MSRIWLDLLSASSAFVSLRFTLRLLGLLRNCELACVEIFKLCGELLGHSPGDACGPADVLVQLGLRGDKPRHLQDILRQLPRRFQERLQFAQCPVTSLAALGFTEVLGRQWFLLI